MSEINDLPNELMVETFSYLGLSDLIRCMRVSKHFKAITEHSAFDKIFFRTKTIKAGDFIDLDKIQVNPALDQLCYNSCSQIEDAVFLLPDYADPLALINSTAAKQNFTEPAITRIIIRPYGDLYGVVRVESDQGVTVQDVMEGLCSYYKPDVFYDECHYNFEGFCKTKNSTEDELVLECCWGS